MGMQGNGYGASILRHSSTSEGIHLMSTPSGAAAVRLAIIGGGPRAIGVLERVAAHVALPGPAAALRARPLHIDVIDPHMPGSGRIWRADESRSEERRVGKEWREELWTQEAKRM